MEDMVLKKLKTNDITYQSITVCGSFGFGNIGDEAVPLAIADMAEEIGLETEINVLGRFQSTPLVNVIDLSEKDSVLRKKIKGLPILLCGGGIIEAKNSATLFRCSKFFNDAFSRKALLFAASVEPGVKYSWFVRQKIKYALRTSKELLVRDVLSAEILKTIVPNGKIEVIGDSVLWLKSRLSEIPDDMTLPAKYIAVTLASRWSDNPDWTQWIATQLIGVATELDIPIVFVPMSTNFDDDRPEHRRVKDYIKGAAVQVETISIEADLTPRATCAIFEKAVVVISMRLHGCVMAYSQKTPFVALAYHPKLLGFARTVGWEDYVVPKEIPKSQTDGKYGFGFEDFVLNDIDLPGLVQRAIKFGDFTQLQFYKNKLANVFSNFMHKKD
jgi:polysaccharide pyruvyl transferase WcaK-like protein